MTRKELKDRLNSANITLVRVWDRWKWIEVRDAHGHEFVIGVQNAHCYHAFYTFRGTASGTTPETCMRGGLGDAIDTDAQMRGYRKLVLNAPRPLCRKYEGLYAASADEFNRQ